MLSSLHHNSSLRVPRSSDEQAEKMPAPSANYGHFDDEHCLLGSTRTTRIPSSGVSKGSMHRLNATKLSSQELRKLSASQSVAADE